MAKRINNKYPFGNQLNKDNYDALRKLAQKLSYRDFNEATGFGQGIYTRTRKFSTLEGYKKYIAANREKYDTNKSEAKVTLRDVYQKLMEIEKKLA